MRGGEATSSDPTCGEVAGVGGGAVKARQCLALVSMAFIPMRAMETRAKQLTENEKLLSEKRAEYG